MKAAKTVALLVVAGAVLALAAWFLHPPPAAAILLTDAKAMPVAAMPGILAVTLTIENAGGPDRLLEVHAPEGGSAQIAHAVDTLAIPAGTSPSFAADGAYLMLMGVEGPFENGRLVPVLLIFEVAGEAATKARIDIAAAEAHAKHAGYGPSPEIADPPPMLDLAVAPDDGGWQVTATAANFSFSHEGADGAHVPGEGHAHLYLNGLKLGRLYEPQGHIGALPPGTYEIRATLTTNDHRPYFDNDAPVSAAVTLAVR